MKLKKSAILIIALVIALGVTGCVKTYQELRLKSDLSGSIYLKVHYDLEALAQVLSMMQGKKMSTDELKEEIETSMQDEEALQNQLEELGGLRLEKLQIKTKGNKLIMKIKIAFDNIADIKKLKDFQIKGQNSKSALGGGESKVFEGLSIVEEGEYLIIKQKGQSKETQGGLEMADMMPPEIKKSMKGFGAYFRVRLPYVEYDLVEHSADKYDEKNHTLYWSYTFDKLKKWSKEKKKVPPIYIKMKKK